MGRVKSSTSTAERMVKSSFAAMGVSGVAIAGAFIMIGKKAIDAASNLEEVTGKFNVVFERQTDIANKWAANLVDNYAMSTREAKEYLSAVQDLLVPMGMNAKAAGQMSNEIVKLSADLGSFNNLPTAAVMGDIQSALVGNYETMKKYGVVLNASTVKQEALTMGLAETAEELTAADKAQAAYALMVKSSTAAIGDMARTSDGYANQMKQLKANVEEFQVLLGEQLLPSATKIVTALNDWIKANKQLISDDVLAGYTALAATFKVITETTAKLSSISAKTFGKGFFDSTALGQVVSFYKMISAEIGVIKSLTDDVQYYKIPDQPPPPPPPAGGDESEDDQEKKRRLTSLFADDYMGLWLTQEQERYEFISRMFDNELELERQRIEESEQMEADFWQHKIQAMQEAEDQAMQLIEKRKAIESQAAQTMVSQWKFAFQAFGKDNEAAFNAFKAISVAETVVNTAKAAMGAFSAMASIPYVGPALGAIAAAGAIAYGAAQISMINSMSPGGGAGGVSAGSGGGGGGASYLGPGSSKLPDFDPAVKEPEKRGKLVINVENFMGDERFIDELVERINDAEDRDVIINTSRQAAEVS